MDREEVAERLVALAQLDIDAAHAYGQAVDRVDDPLLRSRLAEFRSDHERHVEDLSALIRVFAGNPPHGRDFKGLLTESFTLLRSLTGTEGAWAAMKTNEALTNQRYHDALANPLPPEVRGLLERHLADEKRHLAYIEQVLRERPWERLHGLI